MGTKGETKLKNPADKNEETELGETKLENPGGKKEETELLKAIIGAWQFKRLKEISQLGAVQCVFPNATHKRYDHCIRVCNKAGVLARKLRERSPQYNITDADILCVQIAALCYSLGQGPYSHFYFKRVIPEVKRTYNDRMKEWIDDWCMKLDEIKGNHPETEKDLSLIIDLLEKSKVLFFGEKCGCIAKCIELFRSMIIKMAKIIFQKENAAENPRDDETKATLKKEGFCDQDVRQILLLTKRVQLKKCTNAQDMTDRFSDLVEDWSCAILDEILQDKTIREKVELARLTDNHVLFIKALIKGKPDKTLRPHEKDFLYEIVNNQYNGIDVKLWDYLENDLSSIKGTAQKSNNAQNSNDDEEWKPDYSKLLATARVMDVEDNDGKKQSHVVYLHEAIMDIHRLYRIKEMMHQKVYQHTDVNGAELTISNSLLKEKKIFFSVLDLSTFCELNDDVVPNFKKLGDQGERPTLLEQLSNEQFYKCFATKDVVVKRTKLNAMMKNLKEHLEEKIKAQGMESDVVVDVVHFREEFDPSKVWLYDKMYSSFPMSSADSYFYWREKYYEDIKPNEKRVVPYYDPDYDKWISSKELLRNDCLKLMEQKEYITCSVRLYCKNDPIQCTNPAKWSQIKGPEKTYICLNEMWNLLVDQFHGVSNKDDSKGSANWLDQQCDALVLKERIWSTSKMALSTALIGIIPGVLTWGLHFKLLLGPALTYVAGYVWLWVYDQLQMAKRISQFKLRNSEIKQLTATAFVLSTIAIATIPNPKATFFRHEKSTSNKDGCTRSTGGKMKTWMYRLIGKETGWKFMTVHMQLGSRLGRGFFSGVGSALIVTMADGLYPVIKTKGNSYSD